MSIWHRISQALAALTAGEGLASVFEKLRTPPEKTVAFAIAVIALGAKMAKADGRVTRDEVVAFREVFLISKADESGAAKVFNLARQDVAGYEEYARRVYAMFSSQPQTLLDLLEGLFHIAIADGVYHPGEEEYLEAIANIFGISEADFALLRARFVPGSEADPYAVLGVAREDDPQTIRAAWRKLVRENHPDALMARGVPQEAIKLGEKRLADINLAWEQLSASFEQPAL